MYEPGQQANDPLTKRQREVLERLEQGYGVKKIARDLGVTRAAVYQHVERLRRHGALAETYTPSGQRPRRADVVGSVNFGPTATPPRESTLARLRELAGAGEGEGPAYAEAIEGAIAGSDTVGLAYELGRLDAIGGSGLPLALVESALTRLSVLPAAGDDAAE